MIFNRNPTRPARKRRLPYARVALTLEELEGRRVPSLLHSSAAPAPHAPLDAVPVTWQGADIAVGTDNQTRLLWSNSGTGSADTWTVNNSLVATAGPVYGSDSNWVAHAIAAGADGNLWVLWTNGVTGATALWKEDAGGTFVSAGYCGSISPWRAEDVAVGTDNLPRILWQNSAQPSHNEWCVWTVDSNFTPLHIGSVYGDFAVFPSEIAAGSDGQFRILGSLLTGPQTIWVVSSSGVLQSTTNFNSLGWLGEDIALGPNNQTYLLWAGATTRGTAAIWQIDTSMNVVASFAYGPGSFVARRIDVGADGTIRLLWNATDGTADLWLINADGSIRAQQGYGPF
jgi:hypothetical protein